MSFPSVISTFDIVLVVVLGLFALRGAFRGLMQEFFGFAGLFLGLVFASTFAKDGIHYIYEYVGTIPLAYTLSYIGIILITFLGVYFVSMAVESIVKIRPAKSLDLLGGVFFALAKGCLLISLLLIFFGEYFGERPFMKASQIVPYLDKVSQYFSDYLPYFV